MGDDVVEFFEDLGGGAWDAISDVVEAAWDSYVWAYVEIPLAVFGIVDEDVIVVQKTSTLVYEDNDIDVVEQANVKSVMSMVENGSSFFEWYRYYTGLTPSQIQGYYRFAYNDRYIYGLPNMRVTGGAINFVAIDAALNDSLGFEATRLSSNTRFPEDEVYIQNELQTSHSYKPWNNTLTFSGDSTWTVASYVYNSGPDNWTVNIEHATNPDDTITVNGFVKERSLIVKYHADTDPATEWFYWIYEFSSNTYPAIDPSSNILSNFDMLPVAILKQEGVDINTDKESELYISTKRLVDGLGLSIDEILDSAGTNSYYGSVQDLYLNFAVNSNSTDEAVSQALWLTFYNIIVTNNMYSAAGEYVATFEEQNVNNALVWKYHAYFHKTFGVVPDGKDYHHYTVTVPADGDDPAFTRLIVLKKEEDILGVPAVSTIYVDSLSGFSAIKKDGYHSMHFSQIGDDELTIPISQYVLNEMDKRDIMRLYQHMVRVDAYAAEIIHLEYYETPTFAQYFELGMIVITIWSLGSATGPIQVITKLLTQYLIMEMVVYLAELTGNAELAAIIGLVAAIALADASGLQAFDFQTAEGLIQASTSFANNLTVGYNTISEGIQDDLVALNEMAEGRLQEIEDAAPDRGPVTAEFLVALRSVDTTVYPAVKAQYNFDLLYNYDRLIADYYNINLNTGVT